MNTLSNMLDTSLPAVAVSVPSQDPTIPAELHAEIARLGLGEAFPEAIALTREIFGDFTIVISEDPEIHNCSYVTFKVQSSDTLDDAFAKESDWIRRVRWPTQAAGSFCINIRFSA